VGNTVSQFKPSVVLTVAFQPRVVSELPELLIWRFTGAGEVPPGVTANCRDVGLRAIEAAGAAVTVRVMATPCGLFPAPVAVNWMLPLYVPGTSGVPFTVGCTLTVKVDGAVADTGVTLSHWPPVEVTAEAWKASVPVVPLVTWNV
jgi:hypothetical protein